MYGFIFVYEIGMRYEICVYIHTRWVLCMYEMGIRHICFYLKYIKYLNRDLNKKIYIGICNVNIAYLFLGHL